MFPCIYDKISSVWHLEHEILQNEHFKHSSSKEPSFWKCALLEERMLKLLVNDKCMIVEVPIAYIVTLAMCHL